MAKCPNGEPPVDGPQVHLCYQGLLILNNLSGYPCILTFFCLAARRRF